MNKSDGPTCRLPLQCLSNPSTSSSDNILSCPHCPTCATFSSQHDLSVHIRSAHLVIADADNLRADVKAKWSE